MQHKRSSALISSILLVFGLQSLASAQTPPSLDMQYGDYLDCNGNYHTDGRVYATQGDFYYPGGGRLQVPVHAKNLRQLGLCSSASGGSGRTAQYHHTVAPPNTRYRSNTGVVPQHHGTQHSSTVTTTTSNRGNNSRLWRNPTNGHSVRVQYFDRKN